MSTRNAPAHPNPGALWRALLSAQRQAVLDVLTREALKLRTRQRDANLGGIGPNADSHVIVALGVAIDLLVELEAHP